MTRTTIDGSKTPFLPERVTAFLRRRAIETAGLALAAAGAALLVALATYSAGDPSLNNAVDGPVRNALGAPGAIAADLGLQSIGLAAVLPGLILICWGLRVMTARPVAAAWLRVAILPVSLVALAAGLAGMAPPAGWTLRAGLGGYLGQFVLGHAQLLAFDLDVSQPILALALPLLALGLGLAFWLAAFSPGEWRAGGARLWRFVAAFGRLGARSWHGGRKAGQTINDGMRRRFGARRPRIEPRMPFEDLGPFAARPRLEARDDEADEGTGAAREAPPIEPRADTARARRSSPERQAALNLVREGDYELPGLDLLDPAPAGTTPETQSKDALEANAKLLMGVLEDFGVRGEIIKVRPGPVVTLYELEPAPGIKSSRVIGLADDIARSMSAVSVRIAVVPGRNVIGIELPNARRETVYLRELLGSDSYERTASKLTLVLGKDIGGGAVMADLARMPHLLIAGTTGSGKSVAINTMILSLLYRLTPDECRFIMIDPKMLELSVYDGIPHLLAPVVTEPGKAVIALRWTVKEMENRYRAMSELGVRNIQSYNQRLAEARRKGHTLTRRVQTGFDPDSGRPVIEEQELDLKPLPVIVVVVDEMADLMLVAGKEIEGAVQRLSQMARAAGIHIIMATQRPSVDVITGTIKANFPTRISFQVTSKIDSRTILGEPGAEQLLGQGDMLYMAGGGRITRVHGPFVSDREVERVVGALAAQGEPDYVDAVTEDESFGYDSPGGDSGDALYDQAVSLVLRERRASTSFIQRHLQIGYNRAARIMDQMEAEGVVSAANHAGKREVLPGGSA